MYFKIINALTGISQVAIGYAVWTNRSATKTIVSKLDQLNRTVENEAKRCVPPAPNTREAKEK